MNPIIIDLPLPPDCLHPNARPNRWGKAKAVASARGTAKLVAMASRPKSPLTKPIVSLDFYLKRTRDVDGLVSFCKAYFDGIQDARVYENDSAVELGHVRRHKAKDRQNRTGVVFTIVEGDTIKRAGQEVVLLPALSTTHPSCKGKHHG